MATSSRMRRLLAVIGLCPALIAAAGCASLNPGAGPQAAAQADSTAARQARAEQRAGRIEDALERQEMLLRRTNADLSAQLEEVLREMQVLGERIAVLEQRLLASRDGRAQGGPAGASLPGQSSGPAPEWGERLPWTSDISDSGFASSAPSTSFESRGGEGAVDEDETREPGAAMESGGAGREGVGPSGLPPGSVEGQRMYEEAYRDLMQDNFQLALMGFRGYLERFPDTALSDNAQYWIAEIYYKQRQFTTAVEEFIKVVEEYHDQDKVPAAYYKLGLCFRNLRDETTARRYFELVVAQYPGTREAQLAAERLAGM
ncbi:MAG: tol-pal system protein YbgF [Candidatus Eisenbacteria bacterium]